MPKEPFWTDEELKWLTENYNYIGHILCSEYLGRSASAVLHKASRLGLKRKGVGRNPRTTKSMGYIYASDVKTRYAIHRKLMEEHIGRELTSNEIVHHRNGDKTDNRLENLEIVSRSEHMLVHNKHRLRNKNGTYKGGGT